MTDQPLSTPPEPARRNRGGQPGNQNGLKHGLYIQGNSIRNLTPVERACLCDLTRLITEYKQFMHDTWLSGKNCRTVAEFNDTMRTLAVAASALTRLLTIQNSFHITSLPSDIPLKRNTTVQDLVSRFETRITEIEDLLGPDPADGF